MILWQRMNYFVLRSLLTKERLMVKIEQCRLFVSGKAEESALERYKVKSLYQKPISRTEAG